MTKEAREWEFCGGTAKNSANAILPIGFEGFYFSGS
jgi:hypothetical protein